MTTTTAFDSFNFRHSYVDMFRMLDNEEKGYVSITELLQSLQNSEVICQTLTVKKLFTITWRIVYSSYY